MKKILFLFFLLLIGTFVQAHPILDGLEKSYQSKKHSHLMTYLEGLRDQSTDDVEYGYSTKIHREIVAGYIESKYEIKQSTLNKGIGRSWIVDRFKISIINLENKIVFYRIDEVKYLENLIGNMVQTPILIKQSKVIERYQYFEKSFLNTYGAPLNFDDLFVDNIVYGSICGFGGQDPKYREELNLFIEKKDKIALLKWLSSATTELQIYAIDGILSLSKKGVRFKAETYETIKLISQKEGDVYTCSGCTHWNRPIKEIVRTIFVKYDFIEE